MEKCNTCNREKGPNNLRFGTCFDCADAESIIASGLDMYDKGPRGDSAPAKTTMDRLKFLIQKRWQHGKSEVNT